jgi:hypothetical protein
MAIIVACEYRKNRNEGRRMTDKRTKKWVTLALSVLSVAAGFWLLNYCYELLTANPEMPARQYQIVRLGVGLAAGFISAGLTGPFEISGDTDKFAEFFKTSAGSFTIKAGGSIGIAVLVYLV